MKYVSKLWLIFSQDLSRKMLQSIISGMSDSVPNVRINAAKAGLSAIVNPKCSYAVSLPVTSEHQRNDQGWSSKADS
jgi:hypothetical protein